ncbi:MAG TPA: hypothetical protein VFW14_10610 [Gaiellales bacterium]|nr:hypothetical protein [Gaiellales bacterium]
MTEEASSLRGPLAVLGGVVAVLAALLGFVQLNANRHSDRAAAEGTRLAVAIFRDTTAAGGRLDMKSMLLRQQTQLMTNASGMDLLTAGGSSSGLAALSVADEHAAKRLGRLWQTMTGTAPGPPGAQALGAEQAALKVRTDTMVARQNALMDEADRYGRKAQTASRGLLLAATAGAVFTLAGAIRERRPAKGVLGAGVLLVIAAALAGVLAAFVY